MSIVSSNPPLRAGVVGVGVMGWNHARVLRRLEGVELVGLTDPDAARAARAAAEFGAKAYASPEALAEAGLDFVVVAAPNALHRDLGTFMLARGLHVLMEKPIAPTVADARALIDAAQTHGRKLMVGHVERFNPAVQAAKKACAGEQIISVAITRVGPFPPRMSDIGVVIDLGVHDIDLIRTVTGSEIAQVQAQLSSVRAEREDTALLQFRTDTNVVAQINTNWTTPFKTRTMQIATTQKFVSADLMTRQVSEYFDYREDGSYSMRHLPVPLVEPLVEELAAFARAIREDRECPVSGEEGLRNLEVALACLESARRPA